MKQWPGVFFLVLGLDVVLTVAANQRSRGIRLRP